MAFKELAELAEILDVGRTEIREGLYIRIMAQMMRVYREFELEAERRAAFRLVKKLEKVKQLLTGIQQDEKDEFLVICRARRGFKAVSKDLSNDRTLHVVVDDGLVMIEQTDSYGDLMPETQFEIDLVE